MYWNGDKIIAAIDAAARVGVKAAATELVSDVKIAMSKPVGYDGDYVIRSRPGEPPRRETSSLVNSIERETTPGAEIEEKAGSGIVLGKWMELGRAGGAIIRPKTSGMLSWATPGGGRSYAKSVVQGAIAPRPAFRPVLAASHDKIVETIADSIKPVLT